MFPLLLHLIHGGGRKALHVTITVSTPFWYETNGNWLQHGIWKSTNRLYKLFTKVYSSWALYTLTLWHPPITWETMAEQVTQKCQRLTHPTVNQKKRHTNQLFKVPSSTSSDMLSGYWEVVSSQEQKFSKILIFTWLLKFSNLRPVLSFVFSDLSNLLHLCLRKLLWNTQV